ncbi:MAG: penicillin-binding protein 2 [Lachnospiraceae bacterium]|nr:penicillin-binding protein 2 [Lachnospiraceae bacterium]
MLQRKKKKKKKQEEQQERRSNRELYFTGGFFALLFAAMIGYYAYFVQAEGREMINNSYNSRQYILASQNIRGTIYSADGEVLAETLTDVEGKETRTYPYENLFAHVIGFSTKGKTGIEAEANSYLIQSSIPLSSKVENEVAARKHPGDNVYTSLRTDLQEIASKSLGVYQGAIIVSNVKTGEILAMVSKPDFNPETIVEDWEKYVENENSSVLLNRATQGIYPPGSTFKMVTALAYLRQFNGDYTNYRYQCNGSMTYGNSRITCYHGAVHGSVDFISSFAKSCNCSFANMGLNLDRDIYHDTVSDLGFNESLPVNFNYSKSNLTVDDGVSDEDMIQISFGQGSVQMTPLHLHLVTNAVAMGGTPMKPYLISQVESAEGEVVKTFKPESYKELMTAEEAATLTELMTAVVESGTATRLKGLEYTAAGKTGSAEYNKVKEDSHAWFTGFAPAEDPEISVTIIVEKIGSGGDYAVPIAKRLFDAYFGL